MKIMQIAPKHVGLIQGGSNMTVNKSQFVPVIFEPPCNTITIYVILTCVCILLDNKDTLHKYTLWEERNFFFC